MKSQEELIIVPFYIEIWCDEDKKKIIFKCKVHNDKIAEKPLNP